MNERTSRTLAVIAPYFPPHAGGLERYAFEIARRLQSEYQWRVIVITSGERYGKDVKEQKDGLTTYRLGYCLKISNTPLGFSWFHKIRRILKQENPDIVNVHTPVPGIGDIAACCTRKIPLVVTYHMVSMRKGKWLPDIGIWLYEHTVLPLLLRRADRIICSSNAVRYEFLSTYESRCTTITPAVDHEFFSPHAKKRARGNNVLFVAADLIRACEYKGLAMLIEAIDILRKKGVHACLTVVGDGDMRKVYEASVRARGLEGTVRFKGRLERGALIAAYREADIFVLPSAKDNHPLVILEAMAAGLPVISTTVGDIPILIKDGITGFLIEPYDRPALVEKLEVLLHNPKKAAVFGAAARERVVREFGWRGRAESYKRILEDAVTQKKCIALINAYYPPPIGGIERIVQKAAESLAERMRVVVFTSSGSSVSRITKRKNLTIKELASFEFAHTPFCPTLLFHLIYLPKTSIIHLHLAQAYWPEIVRLASFVRRIPYIVHFHLDVGSSGPLGRLFLLYKRIMWPPLLRGAHKVIVCSKSQVEIVHKKYGVAASKITVIPNAVDERFFSVRNYTAPKDIFRLLYVGRLAPQKRVGRLLEACAKLTIPWQLTIIGDGEERRALETLAAKRRLAHVSFVGAKHISEIQRCIGEHDAFLISSDQEGAPLAVLEACASGLPVIGSNVIGIREILTGVGVLVDEPYPQRFAEAISALWRKPARLEKMSKLSIGKARQYTWPRFVSELERVYQEIPD